ncbi:hypothetical protein [Clostridium sp. AF32-12BH]|uniref:hypothetical protein n=1 Tax=Clostridium sp. AF32-12BH TaxID=2292006 RepID=UPI000E508221|nr:hypothetical protein [Clostridium sp. AF32-12BH]RHP49158.1 hypothetical protein DWZ40_02765 [Clostridium sp. AF32-12BH]
MNKRIKRILALMLACTIVIGSVNNARFESRASAAGIIAGGGAAVVGIEVAFPYLLAVTGVVAAATGVYKNRESIKEWGSTQWGNFKQWFNDNKDKFGWAADAAVASAIVDKWGEKLSSGKLDKADPTWDVYEEWLKSVVYKNYGVSGNPYVGKDAGLCTVDGRDSDGYILTTITVNSPVDEQAFFSWEWGSSTYAWWGFVTKEQGTYLNYQSVYSNGQIRKKEPVGVSNEVIMNGEKWYYAVRDYGSLIDWSLRTYPNFVQTYNKNAITQNSAAIDAVQKVITALTNGDLVVDGEKDYNYVGGVGEAGVDDTDVVNKGAKEGETEVSLPWSPDLSLDDLLRGLLTGDNTWTDILEKLGVGVIDRTAEGDMIIDEDGVTTKKWEYAPAVPTTPDVTLPDASTKPSKELGNYTFAGLEKIFPFCLPFDAIDFVKVLEAEPQAPHFTFPIKYPTGNGWATYDIDIDLSPFDVAAEILRDMECLLFIVGLIMVTRSQMIRG